MSAISKIESLIQSGNASEGRRLLHALLKDKIPRTDKLQVARLCRRANLAVDAIRILSPLVRPTGKNKAEATPSETAEYAASLTYLGAGEEALRLLRGVDKIAAPEALLFEAFALFPNWDYGKAIPILESYASHPSLTDYQRLVGKVNLLAALVDQHLWEQSEPLAAQIAEEAKRGNRLLLYGNILELTSQIAIFNSQWERARKLLDEAEATLNSMGTIDHLFVEKWRAILELTMSHGKISQPLKAVRATALKRKHWETVRDCDRHLCVGTQDQKLFQFLYFGSPFPAFRKALVNAFEGGGNVPESYEWSLLKGKAPARFSSAKGQLIGAKNGLKEGQSNHRLLLALTRDFYRPLRVASAHHTLYPDDYYNPVTSPKKVYELVRRCRKELKQKRIPLEIVETDGSYTLKATQPLIIELKESRSPEDREAYLLVRLQELQKETAFSLAEAQSTLQLSRRTLQRVLQYGVEYDFLSREGQGPATRYHFKK